MSNNIQRFIRFSEDMGDGPKLPIRVRIGGRFVKMASGKSCWPSIGAAKAALKEHFKNKHPSFVDEIEGEGFWTIRNKRWQEFVKEMENSRALVFAKF